MTDAEASPDRVLRRDLLLAAGGFVGCGAFAANQVPHLRHEMWAHALVLFAALVILPLANALAEAADDPAWLRALWRHAWWARTAAAVVLSYSLQTAPGVPAALGALPWVAFLGAWAAVGAARLWRHRGRDPVELTRDAALVFAAVGAAWLFADRLGLRPLGFSPAIVMLTAVHFHFAGIVLPLVTARALAHVRAPWLGWWVVAGVPLVAVGITVAQLGGGGLVEAVAAWAMSLGGLAVAAVHWQLARHPGTRGSPRVWWRVAAASLAFGMLLAALYGSRGFLAVPAWLDVPWMRAVHGSLNAVGFGFCAVLGWRIAAAQRAPDGT